MIDNTNTPEQPSSDDEANKPKNSKVDDIIFFEPEKVFNMEFYVLNIATIASEVEKNPKLIEQVNDKADEILNLLSNFNIVEGNVTLIVAMMAVYNFFKERQYMMRIENILITKPKTDQ